MKFKPAPGTRSVLVELGPGETQLPAAAPNPAAPALSVFKLKKILVPLDFSDCSKKALQYAAPFAKQFGAELILLHVIQPYPQIPEMASVDVDSIQDSRAELAKLGDSVDASIAVSTLVQTGDPPRAIAQAANDLRADLVILSTHGYTGLSHVLLGSTAERVVRHAPCPVLVVRQCEHEFVDTEPAPRQEEVLHPNPKGTSPGDRPR